MKPVVTVTNWVHQAALDRLSTRCDVIANKDREPWPEHVLLENLERSDAVVTFMPDMIGESVLARARKLKMVSCCLKGFDNFDIEACSRHGVLVSILPDLLTVPGAELAIGLMIAAGRNVLAGDSYIRRGEFKGWRPRFYGTGLEGSTVGIIGLGAVGSAIAERLVPFRCTVRYADRNRKPRELEDRLKVSHATLEDLLQESDFVIVAVSLTPQTHHIINKERLAAMKPGAILVNFARGSLVDEAAVADALASGHLGFYTADVFEFEDWAIPDRPKEVHHGLIENWSHTLLTPHIGSAVTRVREEMAMQAVENVIAFFDGQTPQGALNAAAVAASAGIERNA